MSVTGPGMGQVGRKAVATIAVAVVVAFLVVMVAVAATSHPTAEAESTTFLNGRFEVVEKDRSNGLRMIVRDVDTGEWYFYEKASYGNVEFEHLPGHAGE